jgi:periplasmic protein TonB
MFEDCLVESSADPISPSKRWTTFASISLQFAVAAVVIALPLLHPETLPFHVDSPKVLLPLPPKPPVPTVREERPASSSASNSVPVQSRPLITPSLLPSRDLPTNDNPPPLAPAGTGMNVSDGIPNAFLASNSGHGPRVSIAPPKAPAKLLHVSSGVSEGMLMAPIRPIYPAIAKAAHVEGTVVVEALISKTGTIESLHVVGGPPLLQSSALDAIRAARYQPYRLNGEPTEVQTTITVNFRIGG